MVPGWTCSIERAALGAVGLLASIAAVGLCLLGFERLRAWGAVLVGEAKAKNLAWAAPAAKTEGPLELALPVGVDSSVRDFFGLGSKTG